MFIAGTEGLLSSLDNLRRNIIMNLLPAIKHFGQIKWKWKNLQGDLVAYVDVGFNLSFDLTHEIIFSLAWVQQCELTTLKLD